jgi:hypothetical protein
VRVMNSKGTEPDIRTTIPTSTGNRAVFEAFGCLVNAAALQSHLRHCVHMSLDYYSIRKNEFSRILRSRVRIIAVYSCRSARIGSNAAARRAGIQAARAAIADISAPAATKLTGSVGAMP